MKGNAHRGHELAFGSFGIKTLEEALITARQIEAARQAVTRYMKREGQIWIRIFPDKPISVKAKSGSASSPTNPSQGSLWMSVWVKVRVIPNSL